MDICMVVLVLNYGVVTETGSCRDGGSDCGEGIPGSPDGLSDVVSARPGGPEQGQIMANIYQGSFTAL